MYDPRSEPKEFVEIEGASHVDLYDIDEHVNHAVEAMDGFFNRQGGQGV